MKAWWEFLVELLIAGSIVYFSFKLFLLYFFFIWLWKRYEDTEFIRKNINVLRVSHELKTAIIMEKMNISRQECINIKNKYFENNKEAGELFRKDQEDLNAYY